MPREVEELDRNPQVGLPRSRDGCGPQAIFPRTGEQPERVVWTQLLRQRRRQAMDVFADTRPLPKRRAVVHEDAHAGES
jgi:hypothetical protein